MATTMDHVMSK